MTDKMFVVQTRKAKNLSNNHTSLRVAVDAWRQVRRLHCLSKPHPQPFYWKVFPRPYADLRPG